MFITIKRPSLLAKTEKLFVNEKIVQNDWLQDQYISNVIPGVMTPTRESPTKLATEMFVFVTSCWH